MFKRLLTLVALMAALLPAVPAHAVYPIHSLTRCVTYKVAQSTGPYVPATTKTFETCFDLDWKRQADGDGTTVVGATIRTPRGCGYMEENGPYGPSEAKVVNPGDRHLRYYVDWNTDPCAQQHSVDYGNGPDAGNVGFKWHVKARINNGEDRHIYMDWTLKPDGQNVLESGYVTDDPRAW